MPLTNTRALMAELATTLGISEVPQSDSGGFELAVGDDGTVQIFSQGEAGLLIVAPVGPLPLEAGFTLVQYLLRMNLFDAEMRPFRVAVDDGGGLIVWGSLPIEGLSGAALAEIVETLAAQVAEIRAEVFGDDDDDDDEEEEEEEEDEEEDEDEAAPAA